MTVLALDCHSLSYRVAEHRREAGELVQEVLCAQLPAPAQSKRNTRTASVSSAELNLSASIESLRSRRFKIIERALGPVAAVQPENQQLIIRSDVVSHLATLEKHRAGALIESIARWALSAMITYQETGAQTRLLERCWITAAAIRPILYFWREFGCLPDDFLRPNDSLLNVIRNLHATDLTSAIAQVVFGTGSGWPNDLEADRLELEHRRFVPPQGMQIVMLRHTDDGIVVPVFGSRRFVQYSAFNHPGRTLREQYYRRRAHDLLLEPEDFQAPSSLPERKKAYHVPLRIVRSSRCSFQPSDLYDRLPEVHDLIGPDRFPITVTSRSCSRYSALMYGTQLWENGRRVGVTGRTGVLFVDGHPVIKTIGDDEYLVEIKGLGSPDGGIRSIMRRADGHWSPTGGLEQHFGQDEFESLMESGQAPQGVKAVCMSTIAMNDIVRDPFLIGAGRKRTSLSRSADLVRNHIVSSLGDKVAILVRLTPSIERLSYIRRRQCTADPCTTSSSKPRITERVSLYGSAIGTLLAPDNMRAHLSAHLENLVFSRRGCLWQDHADMLPLYLSRAHWSLPVFLDRRNLTLRLLNQTFFYVARTSKLLHDLSGVDYRDFAAIFYKAFVEQLKTRWVLSADLENALLQASEPLRMPGGGITTMLWRRMLAYDNFRWCVAHYDLPAAIFGEFYNRFTPEHRHSGKMGHCAHFLTAEIQFLGDVVACDSFADCGPDAELYNIAADSISSARATLNALAAEGHVSVASCKSEYLRRSEHATLPRKVQSWPN